MASSLGAAATGGAVSAFKPSSRRESTAQTAPQTASSPSSSFPVLCLTTRRPTMCCCSSRTVNGSAPLISDLLATSTVGSLHSSRMARPRGQLNRSTPVEAVVRSEVEEVVNQKSLAEDVSADLLSPGSAFTLEGSRQEQTNEDATPGKRIWLSDVVKTQKRPYFLNREWTKKDLSYAGYMLVVHGMCLAAPFTFSWSAFTSFAVLYVITGMLGITLSFHRHLSHKSFKLPKWLEYTFAYCGVLAVQGDPLEWVSAHRYHHQHCDTPQDPHTPYEGFWHSHMGWLLDDKATTERVGARANIADMANDPFYRFIEQTYPLHIAAMAGLLYAAGGWPFIVWGLAVRVVWVYHITWFVNSASHVWGTQSWNTGDLSRNNWWVALLAFGEGWHNNHHAFEYSARHGLDWWQLDPTWYTVKLLETLGLATKVRYPTKEHMAKLALKPSN